MEGNPSPVTAGLRSTLHRFFPTTENLERDHKGTIDPKYLDPEPERALDFTDPDVTVLKDSGYQDAPEDP